MKTRLGLALVVIAVTATAIISFSAFNSEPESILLTNFDPFESVFDTAHAGPALDPLDAAQVMRVRVVESGHNNELTIGSFSRIGFIADSSSDFLLESVPSKDKKQFYKFVKESLEDQGNMLANPTLLNIKIDIFSGDYDLINTLSYERCTVTDYFVHGVDSRGKIPFIEDYDGIEIREVTKFSCNSFHLIIDE